MADFDAFESSPNDDVDPAADFLAREQSELAGLEDDNFGDVSQGNNQDYDAFDQGQNDELAQQVNYENTFDGGLADFEMLGGGINDFNGDDGGLFGAGSNDAYELNQPATNGPSNIYEAISQQDTARAVPEKIKIWQEEQKTRLEKKDTEEEKRKKELKEKAKKELEDWYKHHAEQMEKTKENNRAAETAFVKDRDETIPGQSWEKITRLCEFNPKNSKCTKDITRFRSILLQLKQTPLVR